MSDIVERLRDREICPCELAGHQDTINEAADKIEHLMRAHDDMSDTIETLRARVKELEEALRPFEHLAEHAYPPAIDALFGDGFFAHLERARALLAKATGKSDDR